MRLLMISGLTAITVFAAATSMPWSHSTLESNAADLRIPVIPPQGAVWTNKLPVQDFQDRSLEFPRETQR